MNNKKIEMFDIIEKLKTKKYRIIYYIVAVFIAMLVYYFKLPAINIYSEGFWGYLFFLAILGFLPFVLKTKPQFNEKYNTQVKVIAFNKWSLFIVLPIVVLVLGLFFSSSVFFAKTYSNVITVSEEVFENDMPQTETVTNIALMDTESARIIGARELGSLSDVVSQYELSNNYVQINYQGTPQKVSNLEYADFFKWLGNGSNGIPGYVMVDPVNNTAKYIELTNHMFYAESAYFSKNLTRKLRFSYPTKIMGTPKFEVNDDGTPVYVVPCYKPNVFLFGAKDVSEVIIFNPCDGSSVIYDVDETPKWVDIVYDGDLATEKYNWKGMLSGGFINSIVGNKGCKRTTDGYGYLILDDDVWYYTGVTSVNNDESNIGFILTNARTSEYKFYPVIGAEEYSAMGAAQGELQEMGYIASFPSLINVMGQATYIMVLKDNNGLVKRYALVNVERYNIVATEKTQEKVMEKYKQLLVEYGIISGEVVPDENIITAEFTVEDIIYDNGYAYIKTSSKIVLKTATTDDTMAIFKGDAIKVSYNKNAVDNNERVYNLISWEFI